MFCLSVIYPNGSGARFDLDYYQQTHMPLVQDRLGPGGLVRYELAQGTAGWPPTSTAPYVMLCHMYFDSRDALQRAFTAHHAELTGDIPAYTNIRPQLQISEILQ
jgi:uncharacterized protein (TIGR02118 family)